MPIQIAIDGPVASGKSTVARRLAERLGFAFLDTGALYRSVAHLALARRVAPDDETGVDALETVEIDQATGHGSAMTDAASDLAAKFPADRRISQTAGWAVESSREHPFRAKTSWILLDNTSSTNR